jgi:NADH:ubiquinone oxidoreductase subunit 6 (subunit J)
MLILGWIFFSIAAGMFAHIRRNRDGGGWFLIALLFSPLVAFVLLAILEPGMPRLFAQDQMEAQHNFERKARIAVLVLVTAMVLPFVVGAIAIAIKSL